MQGREGGRTAALVAAGAVVVTLGAGEPAHGALEVFMNHLANPRGLAFDGDTLYVAEAGAGGTLPIGIGGAGAMLHYGTTGGVSRRTIGSLQTKRYITGLPSVGADVNGFAVEGPQDVAFSPIGGHLHITIGLAGDPTLRQITPGSNQALGGWLGSVVRQNDDFSIERVLDLGGYEASQNPSGGPLDTNPFSLVFNEADDGFAVTDAGGDYVALTLGGSVVDHVLIPRAGGDAVPTGMVRGGDGALYVAQLTGFPFPQGGANIFRIDTNAADPVAEIFATGFTNLIDMAVDADGILYALVHDNDSLLGPGQEGSIYRVNTDGTSELLLDEGLINPTGLTVGPDGALYISSNGYSPTAGVVLRYALVPEPAAAAMLGGLGLTLALRRRRMA